MIRSAVCCVPELVGRLPELLDLLALDWIRGLIGLAEVS